MDHRDLDRAIAELDRLIPVVGQFELLRERHSWRPVWDQCKVIQAAFNEVRYPSLEERTAAWERFQHLRLQASERKRWEEEAFYARSLPFRDEIMGSLRGMKVDTLVDFLTLHRTSADEMKHLGSVLQNIRERLRECQPHMTYEHVGECRDAIADVKRNYDEWWAGYKEAGAQRTAARAQQQREYEQRSEERKQRIADRIARVRDNIEQNQEKRASAVSALYRAQERLRDTEAKYSETTSEKWRSIFSEWIAEAEEKIEAIESSIRLFDEWIDEGRSQLDGLQFR